MGKAPPWPAAGSRRAHGRGAAIKIPPTKECVMLVPVREYASAADMRQNLMAIRSAP